MLALEGYSQPQPANTSRAAVFKGIGSNGLKVAGDKREEVIYLAPSYLCVFFFQFLHPPTSSLCTGLKGARLSKDCEIVCGNSTAPRGQLGRMLSCIQVLAVKESILPRSLIINLGSKDEDLLSGSDQTPLHLSTGNRRRVEDGHD